MRIGTGLYAAGLLALAACGGGSASRAIFDGPDISIENPDPAGGEFGAALVAADLDGDGVEDLIVGAPGNSVGGGAAAPVPHAGLVYVFRGHADHTFTLERTLSSANWPTGRPNDDQRFGAAIAIGDLDGDGTPDLAIGAPGADAGSAEGAGAVFVVTNPLGGASAKVGPLLEPGGPLSGAAFGAAIRVKVKFPWLPSSPDLMVVGAPGATVDGDASAGRFSVLFGGVTASEIGVATAGPFASPDPAVDGRLGESVLAADLDGDGLVEILAGEPGGGIGGRIVFSLHVNPTTHVVTGSPELLDAPLEFGDGAEFGCAIAAGDLDGDGVADVVVGARKAKKATGSSGSAGQASENGSLSEYRVGPGGLVLVETFFPPDGDIEGEFGASVVLGDVTGDGIDDVIVGSPEARAVKFGRDQLRGSVRLAGGAWQGENSLYEAPAAGLRSRDLRVGAVDLPPGAGWHILPIGLPGPVDNAPHYAGVTIIRSKSNITNN